MERWVCLVIMFCSGDELGYLRAYRRRISAMVSRKEIGVVAFAMMSLDLVHRYV